MKKEDQACRICGCTDYNACPGGCYWVEEDLCSACAEKMENYGKVAFENQAILQKENVAQETHCEICNETLVFAMQDKYYAFSLGLTQVLQCLYLAEQQNCVPKLPSNWWLAIRFQHQHINFDELQEFSDVIKEKNT